MKNEKLRTHFDVSLAPKSFIDEHGNEHVGLVHKCDVLMLAEEVSDGVTADGVPLRQRVEENAEAFRKLAECLEYQAPGAHVEGEHVVDTAIRVIAGQARLIRKLKRGELTPSTTGVS